MHENIAYITKGELIVFLLHTRMCATFVIKYDNLCFIIHAMNKQFGELFKKYRLRSEFESLSDLADELLQQNIIYDQSVFSRWQKGERIPTDRKILLNLIHIFVKKKGIVSLKEINTFLESANQGYLTEEEIIALPKSLLPTVPFQVPRQITNFIGRTTYGDTLKNWLLSGQTVLLHGLAGMGKTSLAIELGHQLQEKFPDGILWHRLDTSSVGHILTSIAFTYGEDISGIHDLQSRASIVRSILANKKVLIIFDNVESTSRLDLLIPNSPSSSVLLTSRYHHFSSYDVQKTLLLEHLSSIESISLCTKILGESYVKDHHSELLELARDVDYLPLALNILAKQLQNPRQSVAKVLTLFRKERVKLEIFTYENRDLQSVLNISFQHLSPLEQKVLTSAGVFGGTDFCIDAIAFINDITPLQAEELLEQLVEKSLIEHSVDLKYRLHPLVKLYIQQHLIEGTIYKKAATYYVSFIDEGKKKGIEFYIELRNEVQNILYIFAKCYELNYWDEVIELGERMMFFIWTTELWTELGAFTHQVYSAATQMGNDRTKIICCIEGFSCYYPWMGDVKKAEDYVREGVQLAEKIKDDYLVACTKACLGRIYQLQDNYTEAIQLLEEAEHYLTAQQCHRELAYVLHDLAQTYMLMDDCEKAKEVIERAYAAVLATQDVRFMALGSTIYYNYLAILELRDNHIEEAKKMFETCINMEEIGCVRIYTRISSRLGLGLICEQYGDAPQAIRYFEEAYQEAVYQSIEGRMNKKTGVFFALLHDLLDKSKYYKPFHSED